MSQSKDVIIKIFETHFITNKILPWRHLDKGTINLMRNRKDAFYHRPLSAREVILSLSNQASINLALCALHHFAKIPVEAFEPLGSFASVCSFTGLWESAKPNNVEEPN